ncbi:MAG: helix-turn-helix domain-containing protein [Lachnospiraceae bacterium]|nr:helix-turn-helix domain-containing protein [Lachnospiraceae bacterium]
MDQKLIEILSRISEEEQAILAGNDRVQQQIYTSSQEFVVDSKKLLQRGKLIDVRHHTRFVYFPKHRHNYVEMVYMCQGSTIHILDGGERVELRQGDLLMLNQNAVHEILPAGEGDIAINFMVQPEFFDMAFCMMEDESLLRDFLIDILIGKSDRSLYLYIQAGDVLPVQHLLENMIWSLVHGEEYRRNINQITMGLLFLHLVNMSDKIRYDNQNQFDQSRVAQILAYIESNYRTATLEELCAQVHQSPSQMSKFIRKHTGHTFKELLQTKRLSQAAFLLTTTELPVADIIAAVGYDNTSYFYRVFQQRYQLTPKEYRARGKNL